MKEISTYSQGIAPHKSCIFEVISPDQPPKKTSFVENAHATGLKVHVWTFRQERTRFEPHEKRMFGTLEEEMRAYLEAGIDGMFADQPDIGVRIRDEIFGNSNSISTLKIVLGLAAIAALLLYSRNIIFAVHPKKDRPTQKTGTKKIDKSNAY